MQREIKFRAWDKEAQEMLTVRDINFCGEELDTYEMQGDWLSFEDVELMQYTGFKDRNGIEIYEGDIVVFEDMTSTESGYWERDCIGIVVWGEEIAAFEVTNRLSAESYEVLSDCEVIGNIYENPELLEVSE